MSKHTPGPWRVEWTDNLHCWVMDDSGNYLAVIAETMVLTDEDGLDRREDAEANARRIVAAVNACEGIPVEMLEAKTIRSRLLSICRDLRTEDGENPEYDRALVEVFNDFFGRGGETIQRSQDLILGDLAD